MYNSNPDRMKTHTRIAGWLLVVNYALMLLGALLAFAIIAMVRGLVGEDPTALQVLEIVGTVIPVMFLVFAVPGILAGIGLLTGKPWARILAIVMAALALTNVPVGTAIGGYVLWVLLSTPEPTQTLPSA
jgi:hypothetical protein